eukprot:TRINITY_DN14175_c0_g1_i8.p2 TRINITY_DN14175_c0_g1~~TRINITY_DN14175_c0_g1_i8.p2  ORF type:complete len:137 (+),score=23.83 TRINITY_DN14175_c0_g1_i8:74-484(+)
MCIRDRSNSKQMPKAAPDHGRDEKDVSSFNDVSDINIAEHFLIVHQDKGNLVNNLKPPFSTIPVKKQQSKRYDLKLPSIRNAQASVILASETLSKSIDEPRHLTQRNAAQKLPPIESKQKKSLARRRRIALSVERK